MLMRDSFGRSLYQAFRLSSLMPTQKDTQSQIARKVKFAIQLYRRSPRSARATRAALPLDPDDPLSEAFRDLEMQCRAGRHAENSHPSPWFVALRPLA